MVKLEAVDLCVIGAGAGGGVLAKEVAEQQISTVVLEAGPRASHDKIPTIYPDWELRRREYLQSDETRDAVTLGSGSDFFEVSRHKGVGGSTLHYEGSCQRVHPNDLKRFSQYGVGVDWPISYEELSPLYDRVESILGMSGALDNPFDPRQTEFPNPPIPFSCATLKLKAAAESLGLHPYHATLAVLSHPAHGRNSCNFCGGCWFGCYQKAISNVAETYIPLAEASGARVREGCYVKRIVANTELTQVTGVEYVDSDGKLFFQPARAVAVCGNGLETPRLLLNSQTKGLANSSGLVGKYFMSHTGVSLGGLFRERVNGFSGPNVNGMIQDFYDSDESRGFLGGYQISLKNEQMGPYYFYKSWAKHRKIFGSELQEFMNKNFGHTATVTASGETFPELDNQVEVDALVRDKFGMPVPKITIRLSENSKKMLVHMEQTLRNILQAAGASEIITIMEPRMIGNQLLGTCRMGISPLQSVTNSWGQTHDISNLFIADGSLLPTSTPANSSLTIQALATRVAYKIVELFKRRKM